MIYLHNLPLRSAAGKVCIALSCSLFIAGCIYQYKAEPLSQDNIRGEINSWRLDDPGLLAFLESNGLAKTALKGHDFSLRRLYLTGLYYKPGMQTAYKKMRRAQIIAEHANFRLNPELGIPFEHHSDTSNGQSEWTIGSVLKFIYERRGKREARQAEAEIGLINSSLVMERLAIDSYFRFEKAYFNYLVNISRIRETKKARDVLRELQDRLQKKYALGAVSQFEVSAVTLELQKRLFTLNLQENLVQQSKDNLLTMTYLSPDDYDAVHILYIDPFSYVRKLYKQSDLPATDLQTLQSRMLGNHIELALGLNAYAQSEAALKLEIEKQYPDIVLSPGFIFDQSDKLWTLGTSWVLPLFRHSRQHLQIQKALEQRKIRQQEIVALQKKLMNSLYQQYNLLLRQYKTIDLSDEIIAAIEKRADLIRQQLQQGGTDSIPLLRNRLAYYQAKATQAGIYHDALIAMADLERLLQGAGNKPKIHQAVTLWIENMKHKDTDEQTH